MKNRLLTLMAIVLASAGCSLKENPEGYVAKENFYQTQEQCEAALKSCYTPIHYIYNGPFLMAVEGCTDIWSCNSSDVNAQLSISPVTSGCALNVWKYAYKGVMRANECVECIQDSPLKENVKAPMVAEARVMRALYYYILTSFMGDVPFYTFAVSDIAAMEKVRMLPRKPASQIRDELYDDLKENAIPYFTRVNGQLCKAADVPGHRSGYALGLMLMAKFAMWDRKWDEALYALNLLEELYGEFTEAAYPLEQLAWSNKFISESIFEIQHVWSPDGAKFYGAVSGLMSPKCSGEGWYDGVYMPMLSPNGSTSTPLRATKHFALFRSANNSKTENASNKLGIFPAMPMKFTNETYDYSATAKRYCTVIDLDALSSGITANGSKVDRRIAQTIGMGNVQTGETFVSVKKGGYFFGGSKFWCPGMTATYDSNNYRLFRYADAVLMQAECYCQRGDAQVALTYLNKVRTRAGIDPFADQTALMSEIMDERARELSGEFHRKFDLVRWGNWYELTLKYNEEARVKANISPCMRFYPIPDTECALSGGALSNPEYESNHND